MKNFQFDVDYVRAQFPALSRSVNGNPAAFFDGPGGNQVPRRVVDAVVDYLYYHNANAGGEFITSKDNDRLFRRGREVLGDFLNCAPEEVVFGPNTTSNNFRLSYGLLRSLKPGDEVIITDIDHEGNRSPWRTLADFGIVVKSVAVDPETCTLVFDDFKAKLSDKTKIVCVNWAANACGTITDVKAYVDLAHEYGAITVVDAVHYAAHKPIDVKAIGTDILVCSAYKFFGPHVGVMYVRKDLGESIKSVRVYAEDNADMPTKMETGTLSVANICGAAAAVEFIADLGQKYGECFEEELGDLTGRRRDIVAGMLAIDAYEDTMVGRIRKELGEIENLKLYMSPEGTPRTTTVSFTIDGVNSAEVGKFLAEKGLFVWNGDFYALEIVHNVLKLGEQGGLVRIGLAPYNTIQEVERLLAAIKEFAAAHK